jgi:hemolysin activation/secretion protein
MSPRHSRKTLRVLTLAMICGVALPIGAFAQLTNTQTSVPIQVNPGAVNAQPENREPAPEQLQPVAPADEIKLEAPDKAPAQAQFDDTKFKVNKIELDGVTLLKDDLIRPLIMQYEGQDLSLNDLNALVEKLNDLYRANGYLTSQFYIPPQNLEGGVVKLASQEGKIGNIEVEGNRFFRTKALLRNLPQQEGDMLNVKDLEKSLNRINQQDQFRLRATLTPGENPGETDIDLDVAERQPWQITPTFDNQGRPYIGTFRYGTEISNNNLLGLGDRFFLKWFMGARHTGVGTSYAIPVNRFGTELFTSFGFNHVDPNIPVNDPQPNIIGNAYNYGIGLAQPIDRERNWVVDAGFNAKRISTFINNDRIEPDGRDDIRSLVLGLTYNRIDKYGRSFARSAMTFAPQWMGADTSFWKAETMLTRVFRLPANNLLILRGYGQFTPDALVPAEMMQIGGANSVRGYTEGLLLGDRGYQLNVEHRWPIPFLRLASPWLADRLQGATFVDFGQTFLDNSNNRRFVFSRNQDATTLLGVGVGARFRFTRFLQGFVDGGFGLLDNNREPYGQPTARVHFGLRSDLLSDAYSLKNQLTDEERAARRAAKRAAKTPPVAPLVDEATTAPATSAVVEPTPEPVMEQPPVYAPAPVPKPVNTNVRGYY